MPDEVRVNESKGIIEVVSSGDLTKQDMERTKAKLQSVLAENAFYRVLIDTTRLHAVPKTFEIFEAWSTHSRSFKIALLIMASSAIAKDVAFAETVGVNRGQVVKLFSDKEEALRWLGADDD